MIGFHCIGMCGPLIMAFQFGNNGTRWQRLLGSGGQLLCYQGGRLVVYLMAGALVGSLGFALQAQLQSMANVLALVTAAVFLILGLGQLGLWARLFGIDSSSPSTQPQVIAKAMRHVLDRWRGKPFSRAFFLGVVMGFLPCMLVFWCLGLAASAGHPVDGALLMALLVAMTTPVLLAAAMAPMVVSRWQHFLRDRISPYAMIFSACWLLLIGLAANGVIAHQHMRLGPWTVMFW